jgi:hypothetical protein
MAFEVNISYSRLSSTAAADLSAKQFFAVSETSTGMNLSTAAKNIDGILQDNPKSGIVGEYAYDGVCKAAISASQALTAGVTLLEVDTGGTLKVLAAGTAIAKSMETLSSTAQVMIIAVKLLRSNAAFT